MFCRPDAAPFSESVMVLELSDMDSVRMRSSCICFEGSLSGRDLFKSVATQWSSNRTQLGMMWQREW